jgi:hypothetical protein
MFRERNIAFAILLVLLLSWFLVPMKVGWISEAVVVDDGTLADWASVTVSYTDALGDSPIDMTDLVFVAFDFDDTWLYVRWDIDNDGTKPAVLYDMGINITASGTTWDIFVAAQIERIAGTPTLTNISIRDAADAHIWNATDDGSMIEDGTLYFDPPPGGTPGTISVEARFPLNSIDTINGLIFSQFRSHSSIQVTSNVKDVVPDSGYIVLSLDDNPPWLANLTDFPDPQSPGGNVNITVDAMDDYYVESAWVNITYPDSSWNNVSMFRGTGNEWFLNTSYLDPGVYTYTAWANDSSNNWNFTGPGTFIISGDVAIPELTNLMDTPDPQSPNGYVNMTVDVTDDVAVDEVWINITYPDSSWLNVSMNEGSGDEWYYNDTYSDLGVHSYTVWANDTSNNWNSTGPGDFTIQDLNGPELSNLDDTPDPQENGGNVNISVDVTDDVAVFGVWVNITYPDSSWNNVSMTPGSGDTWYYDTAYPDLGIHSYTIWANDTNDNWNFTGLGTFTIQDTDGPVLANLDDTPDPQENGGYVNITVDVTDDIGVDEVWVNITYPDSSWVNVSMSKGSANEWFYNDTYNDLGIHSYTVWANDTSDNQNSAGPGTFTIQDTDGPVLANLDDIPDPQENGGYVNVTVDVTDDIGVDEVWVNITYPDSSWLNVSMSKGSGNEWFYNDTYNDLGGYSYTVWANDTSDNWNSAGPGTFTIQDTNGPEFSNLDDTPDPQEFGDFVNISVDVTDDVGVDEVWVNITSPSGGSTNVSMSKGIGDQWFYNTSYSELGSFSYTVWANDTSDNWNSTGPGSFIIQDTTGPDISNLIDTPDPQQMGGDVNITVDVTDVSGVDEVWINITYPNGTSINISMNPGIADEWYFNSSFADAGTYSYIVWTNDTNNNWNFSGPNTFEIKGDVIPPELSNLNDFPDPQNPGDFVNITVDVTDDIAVDEVWVNITYPNSTQINVSMDPGLGIEYYFNTTYLDPGVYSYTVWANDTSNNWNATGPGAFTIIGDVTPPEISNLMDTPDPQNPGGNVNISVDVTDDYEVGFVWMNVTYPNGTSINVSMTKGLGDGWYYDMIYTDLGVYSYTVWTNDTSDNWNFSGPQTFEIKDANLPEFSNLLDNPDPQENGGNVNITVDITDDIAVDVVFINITYPNGSWINVSMNKGVGDEWIFDIPYSDLGVYTYIIWVNDTSDNWNSSGFGTFIIQDTDGPFLSNLLDTPDPQENNDFVNISVDVTDDIGVGGVWVNITFPDGSWQNVSMVKGIGDKWYFNSSYPDLGGYSYTVWANDTSGNWNSTGPGSFTIQDTEPPEFFNLNDFPDPQENGDFVIITVDVIDDVAVDEVWINITFPDSSNINVTMNKGALDQWFLDMPYIDLGLYSYTVWANDTSDNWNSTTPQTFTIQDTQGPEISNVIATPNPQKDGDFVNISVDVTDDIGVGEVWVNITYPNGTSINVSMQKGLGSNWFYNTTYPDLGTHSYTIWANDSIGNWNFSGPRTFDIKTDIIPPLLLNATDFPDPQIPGGYVNITVEAVDDTALGVVLLNVTDPGGSWINVSMTQGSGDIWFYNTTYFTAGIYSYIIWANDTSDNRKATAPGSFLIEDLNPPELDNLQDLPDPQRDGGRVNITVDVTDNVAIYDVWVNITYPDSTWQNVSMSKDSGDGWYFNSSYTDLGIYSYRIWANDTSDNWNFTSVETFTIVDIEPPQIISMDDTPDPQENGQDVNITSTIFDNVGVSEVWIYITYPDGSWTNTSMVWILGNDWFYNNVYPQLGVHSYTLWVRDTSSNWNTSSSGSFTIQDTDGPYFDNLQNTPAIQIKDDFVNISVDVTDDVGVGSVWINITYPDSTWQNTSMNSGGADRWFFNQNYTQLGTYNYIIYANDTSNNWNSTTSGSFEIIYMDSPPILWALMDSPDPQGVGDLVSISVNVADDIQVTGVWLNIEYPGGNFVNASIFQGSGYLWFYQDSFSFLGIYSYWVWACDSGNNWNSSGPRTFTIQDIRPPEFDNLVDSPDPQENNEYVNISIDVFDDIAVSEVWLNIRYPNGTWMNKSMRFAQNDRWYIREPYPNLGLYIYSISACDTSGNWNNSLSQSFIILDTDGPDIQKQEEIPDIFSGKEEVIISYYVTDDIEVIDVYINISLPEGRWINVSMQRGKGNQWFYNPEIGELGNYNYTIYAVDSSSNWNSSGPQNFSIEPENIPPKTPRLLNMVILFIYWPLLLVLFAIVVAKRFDSENRFTTDINKTVAALIKQYSKNPKKFKMKFSNIQDIIFLCQGTGIPPEELVLTILAAENLQLSTNLKSDLFEEDIKMILDSLNDNASVKKKG